MIRFSNFISETQYESIQESQKVGEVGDYDIHYSHEGRPGKHGAHEYFAVHRATGEEHDFGASDVRRVERGAVAHTAANRARDILARGKKVHETLMGVSTPTLSGSGFPWNVIGGPINPDDLKVKPMLSGVFKDPNDGRLATESRETEAWWDKGTGYRHRDDLRLDAERTLSKRGFSAASHQPEKMIYSSPRTVYAKDNQRVTINHKTGNWSHFFRKKSGYPHGTADGVGVSTLKQHLRSIREEEEQG